MSRKIIAVCIMILLVFVCSQTAFAQDFDHQKRGSISLSLNEQTENKPIVGAEFSLYYVATVGVRGDGQLSYTLTDAFEGIEGAIDDSDFVAKIDEFISQNNFGFIKLLTDDEGKAVADDLTLGLYFVKQTNAVEGFSPTTPFLVTVPSKDGDNYVYDVNASPKTDVVRLTSITVKKAWNIDSTTKATDSVTVDLLKDGNVVKTAVLNAQNNWQVTFNDMPAGDGYSIKEVNVPKGFAATYTQAGYVFTVTNTSTLVQTGQLIWPIPVMAVLGLILLTVGILLLKKKRKNNA